MARYIDADELYETVTKKYSDVVAGCYPYNIVAYDMARLVKEAPTADVVPRSEVVNTLDELMKEIREIAERYEKSANETSDYDYARIEYRGCQMGALLAVFKIAKLKKKYTEEKKDEKN